MEKKVRLAVYASIAAILVAFGLLAVPQYIVPNQYEALGTISGYQFFFHAVSDRYEALSGINGVCGLGIASIVLMALALISLVAARFSSAYALFGGLFNIASSILFFCMEASKNNMYGARRSFVVVSWPAYVIGAILVLTGLITLYFTVRLLGEEKKQIASKKSYSYLKK